MAWNNSEYNADEKLLIYDLRQIYATEIIGATLKLLKLAISQENYPQWYHLLKRDLLIEISMKLEPEELKIIKDKILDTKKILSSYPNAYIGKTRDAIEHEKVEDALSELYILMLHYMERHKMFGAKEEPEPL